MDLTGADARDWLQGQVTQDLRPLTAGSSTRGCLCKPTGQLLAHLEIWDLGDALRLLVHERELPALLARIEEAVIVEEVEANVIPARVLHAFGGATVPEGEVRARSRTGSAGFDAAVQALPLLGEVPRSGDGGMGERALDPDSPHPPLRGDFPQGGKSLAFDALTLAAGEPIPGLDTTEKTLPPELGSAFEAATISYRKGCYTGQEVLMRLHSRGHTNRTWRGVLSPVPLEAGMAVTANGAEVGRVTRAAEHPALGFIAGAFLRREADGHPLSVDGVPVEARDFPL